MEAKVHSKNRTSLKSISFNACLLLFLSVISYGCATNKDSGYSCNEGKCYADFENPQYLTLEDCKSDCENNGGVNTSGYNCVSGNCISVAENAQYKTLSECQKSCGNTTNTSGYNCVNGNCTYVSSNAQYKTLSECQKSCVDNRPGKVTFSASWTNYLCRQNPIFYQYSVEVGIGYSSTDVSNNAFFASYEPWNTSSLTWTRDNLSPGVYYYKAIKRSNNCGTGTKQVVNTKSGSFTITAGQTTSVNIGAIYH
jgi:hypothetical protein